VSVRAEQTPTAFHLLAKPTGAVCNLDCSYCFFLSKEMLYQGSRFWMADELLQAYVRQEVAWQGARPLASACRRGRVQRPDHRARGERALRRRPDTPDAIAFAQAVREPCGPVRHAVSRSIYAALDAAP
jgi:hypothetical protein